MLIQALSYNTYQTKNKNNMSFKSNYERERELERLRELERMREEIRQREIQRAREIAAAKARAEAEARAREEARQAELQQRRSEVLSDIRSELQAYPEPDNVMSKHMAGFLSQFTCAIQNNSEHDIREFFADEETAAKLREKLSPTCQHDSIELRKEIQKIDETNDPVMMLIAANNMKKFMPKDGILNKQQQADLIEGLKETITESIKNMDLSKFDEEDRIAIGEMVQKIKASETVDFGISVKLKALIDKLNKNKIQIGFIPPVQVRELESMQQQRDKC